MTANRIWFRPHSKEERAAEEARWQLPETALPGTATKGDVLVLTKARRPAVMVNTECSHSPDNWGIHAEHVVSLLLFCSYVHRRDDHHVQVFLSCLSSRRTRGFMVITIRMQWLEGETARFNTVYAKRDPAVPVIDFLRNAARRAGVIYDRAAAELARQVRVLGSSVGRARACQR